jgi:hypothetical protein
LWGFRGGTRGIKANINDNKSNVPPLLAWTMALWAPGALIEYDILHHKKKMHLAGPGHAARGFRDRSIDAGTNH